MGTTQCVEPTTGEDGMFYDVACVFIEESKYQEILLSYLDEK